MQELGQLAEMAASYAVENPVQTYFAVDAARYGVTALAGDFKARFDYDNEGMTTKDLEKEIYDLEEDLNGSSVVIDSINRYIHSYKNAKLHRFKRKHEQRDTDDGEPWSRSWKDSAAALEPSDD